MIDRGPGKGLGAGWKLGRPIALELDLALSFACQSQCPEDRGSALEGVWKLLGPEARGEYLLLLGGPRPFDSCLEILAILAGVMDEEDYGRASLRMRCLDPSQAVAAILSLHPSLGPSEILAPGEALGVLLDLYPRFLLKTYEDAGLDGASLEGLLKRSRRDLERASSIMVGGPCHEAFWHWLDRFYYGSYEAWRRGLEPGLEARRLEALAALGTAESPEGLPALDWLPPENALKIRPELALALGRGLGVLFCLDPFGIADLWTLEPGRLVVSISRPGPLFEVFREKIQDLALRASALADPSRLAILRMIRQVGLSNTDMAAWLKLSRPTVSVHARILREAGLIRSRQAGRKTLHEIVPGELSRLFHDLALILDLDSEPESEPRPKEED